MEDKLIYNGFYGVELIEREIKGKIKVFERLKIRDAVAAVVVDTQGKVGLVYQYRPCVGQFTIELPAGLMDKPGLTKQQILAEELYEECGVAMLDIHSMSENPCASYYPLCGGSDTRMEIYEVRLNCKGRDIYVDDADVELVKWYTVEEIQIMIACGAIYDGKTLIGLNHFIYKMSFHL